MCNCKGAQHLRAQSYDILQRDDINDVLSIEGWFVALRDCLRLARGGLLWGGIPCNTCLSSCYCIQLHDLASFF